MEDSDSSQLDLRGGNSIGGRRLRVDGQKRTENEYRQMLRLAELENKELKNSLRHVEVLLATTKEELRKTRRELDNSNESLIKCHEEIASKANHNSAQVRQIEEMSKIIGKSDQELQEANNRTKFEVQKKQTLIDMGEMEINRLKAEMKQMETDYQLTLNEWRLQESRANDLDAEMVLKSKENNQLRMTVADLETAMQDLYRSRKGKGTLEIELESLKSDNEHLLSLLRGTSEYCDFEDDQIIKSAKTKTLQGSKAYEEAFDANRRARTGSADACQTSQPAKSKINNDWIPTEAVRRLFEIKKQCEAKSDGKLDDVGCSRILYDLNTIWRNIMRQEIEAQRKKLMAQIQDLRRQVVSRQAYDKGELVQELARAKKQLSFAEKQLQNKNRIGGGQKENTNTSNADELARSKGLCEQLKGQNLKLQAENEQLRAHLSATDMSQTPSRIMKHAGAVGFDGMSNSVSDL